MVTSGSNPTPPTHGASWVALSSFGTVLGVTLALCVVAAWLGAPTIVWVVLTSAIIHSVVGLLLWHRGWYRLATTLGAAGLLFAGMMSHLYTGTVGGLTGTLLLASVITAGGLLGWRAALLDSIAVIASIALAIYVGPIWRESMGVAGMEYVLPESLLLVFVITSVPSWGAYVVAIDWSNRRAWLNARENGDRLTRANAALSKKTDELQQARDEQAAVAGLSLLACTDAATLEVERACAEAINSHRQASRVFQNGVAQVLATRRERDEMLEERARLASRIQRQSRHEALERVAGGVAHDVNNALTIIMGVAESICSDGDATPSIQQDTRSIIDAAAHAAGITESLNLYARGLPLNQLSCDASDVLRSCVPMLERLCNEEITLQVQAPVSSAGVPLSRTELQRILLNLVSNAIHSVAKTDKKEITVRCSRTSGLRGAPSEVTLEVIDSGCGMDERTLEHATEPYFSTTGRHGLGLSTVQGVVSQRDGHLEIQTRPEKGSRIVVRLPSLDDIAQDTSEKHTRQSTARGLLLIDDDDGARGAIAALATTLGYSVNEAADTSQALQQIASPDIGVIICDIRLGEENGFSCVAQLREAGATQPVLFITGYAGRHQQRTLTNEALLVKPFRAKQLKEALRKLLGTDSTETQDQHDLHSSDLH